MIFKILRLKNYYFKHANGIFTDTEKDITNSFVLKLPRLLLSFNMLTNKLVPLSEKSLTAHDHS